MKLKEVQVIMLPTKNSNLVKVYESDSLHLLTGREHTNDLISNIGFPQHLYFISDEEIKKGDWFYDSVKGKIHQCKHVFTNSVSAVSNNATRYTHRVDTRLLFKIIATTDKSLFIYQQCNDCIKIGKYVGCNLCKKINLPQISLSFIKEYCKQGSIDKVMVWYTNGDKNSAPVINNNEITIHPIKDSWNREEVTEICELYEAILNKDTHVMTEKDMYNRIKQLKHYGR